jgi:hypothetical protein
MSAKKLPKLPNKNKIELVLIGVAIALVTRSSVSSSIYLEDHTVCRIL